jgi:DNA-binding XRE family transcriptional regulator
MVAGKHQTHLLSLVNMLRKGSGLKSSGTKGRGRIVISNDPIVKMRAASEYISIAGGPPVKRGKPVDPKWIQKRFGERVRALRKEKDISQEALALVCDLDRAYIGGVERGERNISLVNIYKIAGGLNVPAKELMP